jgi:hypothetical protein
MRWRIVSSAAASSFAPPEAVLLWFAGLSFVLVWAIFRDTALDYRLVMAGALLPDVVDVFTGGAGPMHTLIVSVALLFVVMLATRRRRVLRRRLLAVPIGTFVHLVLDGMWRRTEVFWWPFFGADFADTPLPTAARSAVTIVLMELAGAIALVWAYRRFRLHEPERRSKFLRTGRLGRDLLQMPPDVAGPASC